MRIIQNQLNRLYDALPETPKLVMGSAGLAITSALIYNNIDTLKSLADRVVEMLSPGQQILLKVFGIALLIHVIGVKTGMEKSIDATLKLAAALSWMYVLLQTPDKFGK